MPLCVALVPAVGAVTVIVPGLRGSFCGSVLSDTCGAAELAADESAGVVAPSSPTMIVSVAGVLRVPDAFSAITLKTFVPSFRFVSRILAR